MPGRRGVVRYEGRITGKGAGATITTPQIPIPEGRAFVKADVLVRETTALGVGFSVARGKVALRGGSPVTLVSGDLDSTPQWVEQSFSSLLSASFETGRRGQIVAVSKIQDEVNEYEGGGAGPTCQIESVGLVLTRDGSAESASYIITIDIWTEDIDFLTINPRPMTLS